jgi:hypothetical protein
MVSMMVDLFLLGISPSKREAYTSIYVDFLCSIGREEIVSPLGLTKLTLGLVLVVIVVGIIVLDIVVS